MIEGGNTRSLSAGLRYGMVGGGEGAFIGDVHRKAIALDGLAHISAGCFSRDPANTTAVGERLGISSERLYGDAATMAKQESSRADGIDFVVIVTPNATHYQIARSFLQAGIHVVCDKPLCFEVAEAEELAALAKSRDLLFCVTYAYTGYPAVKQARALIAAGEIGDIRFINAEYPQDWLATTIETSGQRQAAWRTDPTQAGKSNCVGDIGSHVENLVHYITGQRIKRLCARLDSFGPGRLLDDNASIMVEYASGAKGLYWSSQIACGNDNALRIRVYGTKGGLEWEQENPNYLKVSLLGQANAILSRGRDPFASTAQSFSRIPSGHPEGYFEAFANVYAAFCRSLQDKLQGRAASPDEADFPTVASGLAGVKFIGKCVESSQKGAVWVNLD